MKSLLPFCVVVFFVLAANLFAGPREDHWKKVEDAKQNGLPKTAIEELEAIKEGAIADGAFGEAVKSIGERIVLESQIQGDRAEENIVRMHAEIEAAPLEMKPLMEAILANWYWRYFEQNRWRFMQRTRTAEAPGEDIQTWDLARILKEIDVHFVAALKGKDRLKKTLVGEFDGLLEAGVAPDSYRPTLYDFLAYEALNFYQAGEQAAIQVEDAFEVDAAGPIFGDVSEFSKWEPKTTDEASPAFKAIRIYQELLMFHKGDFDRSAYYDADFARLVYGHNIAVGESSNLQYEAALERFIEATESHEVSTRALAHLARQVYSEGEFVEAHRLASRGLAALPDSAGASMCYNLIQEIESKSARLITESVWNAPWPTLNVAYKNIEKMYFRAVAVDFDDYLEKSQWSLGQFNNRELKEEIEGAPPALSWEVVLPPTNDFKERIENLPAPKTLDPGYYIILASSDPSFNEEENQVRRASVWVSDIALVTQSSRGRRGPSGFVLEAKSGAPLAGVDVTLWKASNGETFEKSDETVSDENGQFSFSPFNEERSVRYVIVADNKGEQVATGESYGRGNSGQADDKNQVLFFTDRALYRPGQMIHYKGISVHYSQGDGNYQTLANQRVEVLFHDSKGVEIARSVHTTNDYGSFSGVFTAPRDRLMGRMSLGTLNNISRICVFRVEEYKRPKFQVELAAPKKGAKLDEQVSLIGKAKAYSGAAIGGAEVKWRVERDAQCPSWCWWWRSTGRKTIAHGTALTEADGRFKIEFNAESDPSIEIENEPIFNYSIYADVTDDTGETRSAERLLRVGYSAIEATLDIDEWQTNDSPVVVHVSTHSLDREAQAIKGKLTVYALKQPRSVMRASLGWGDWASESDPTNPDLWELGAVEVEQSFQTGENGKTELFFPLDVGVYRVSLEAKDRYGKVVTTRKTVRVLDPSASRLEMKLANVLTSPAWSVEPGETFEAIWGTGYDEGRAFVELECNGISLKRYWTSEKGTQERIELPITENMRGGVYLRITYVRENRAYLEQKTIEVPWSNKELSVKWERFRSKLLPGEKETWTAVVKGADGKNAAAEMVATLYDASLDEFGGFSWISSFGVFRRAGGWLSRSFNNSRVAFGGYSMWYLDRRSIEWSYRSMSNSIAPIGYEQMARSFGGGMNGESVFELSPFSVEAEPGMGYRGSLSFADFSPPPPPSMALASLESTVSEPVSLDLTKITARKNLNETAFFFPHLLSGDDGEVKMQFTMPEALTEWKFLGFAHDQSLRSGLLMDRVITAKDLMVQPNPPRFVREGDAVEFTVKVSNQSVEAQSGKVQLTFADARSLESVDALLGYGANEKAFDVPAKESRTYSWRISVPDEMGFLTYKAVGATSELSDGEEGFLPVLSRRVLVTESLPLPIRGKTTKQFEFDKLLESEKSDTLLSQSLNVQMVSHPAWYAVMALPYLMEYPYECSEQLFNRLFANTLASHIAKFDPKIRRTFDLWKGTEALDSPLEKNEELKSLILQETPWLRQANDESESRRNVGLLFDENRLAEESARTLLKLSERQLASGLWSWFPGGRPSEYISLYVATGFGRLRHLGVDVDISPALKSLQALDESVNKRYREILRHADPDEYVPIHHEAFYLYGRSFFLDDLPIAKEHQEAVDFFILKSKESWLSIGSRQSQAHLAIALKRFGDAVTPLAIMKSLKERSVNNEEMGMSWRDSKSSWWWYGAPIETQAMMIEAFDEVAQDEQAVEDCKVWLLKQKQTQNWKTTKATADAVYALLLRGGTNLLASDALVEVELGDELMRPEEVEAGTGFYEQTFVREEIKPEMGAITLSKLDEGVSWGSVHWQYLEDIAKITPHDDTPLRLKKTLWVKETTKKGQVLKSVKGPLSVGDELVVRIELRTDRDMEYVHLKDQRGSGTEPVNVFSRYKYQDGLSYYESTRDTASHFFIDYLPKGVYVFEYSTRVQLKGNYQSGIAEIQCMYAPEFNSHSESIGLAVE